MNRLYPKKNSGRYFILTELRKTYEFSINKYLDHSRNQKLLDYGCGDMPYKQLFGDNIDYIGYDLKDNLNATKFLNSTNTTNEENSSYDVVLSSQVLEHVDSPGIYLTEIFRILKETGLVFISTHGNWMYHPAPKDLWRWTSDGLVKLVNDHGFEVLEILSIGDLTTSGLQLFQDGFRNKIPKLFRKLLFLKIQFLQYLFYKKKFSKDGCVYLIIAKKKRK